MLEEERFDMVYSMDGFSHELLEMLYSLCPPFFSVVCINCNICLVVETTQLAALQCQS